MAPEGWLPPQAPGGPPPERPPERAAPGQGPVFVKQPGGGQANGLAVAALVCSIASLTLLVLSLGLAFVLSLPLAIVAWVCAAKARAAVKAGRAQGGDGQAQAALVLAMLGVALSVAAMVVWIALIASGFSIEEFQDDLERELERQRRSNDPLT